MQFFVFIVERNEMIIESLSKESIEDHHDPKPRVG